MELTEYQIDAYEFAAYPEELRKQGRPSIEDRVNYALIGLVGEAGELLNKWKKVYRDNKGKLSAAVEVSLLEEAGDVLWYIAALHTELGKDLTTTAETTLLKLQDRKNRDAIKGQGDHR